MIPYTDFARLLTDTTEFDTLEEYTAECGSSVPMDDVQAICKLLERIWLMGHNGLTFQRIKDVSGRKLQTLVMDYGLPCNTTPDCNSSEWVLPLLAYAVLSDM